MIKILFVDDEPNVSEGLRRMLRPMRRKWEMEFVASGAEALARMAATSFDVIVSDMRMPGMDGGQLLTEVMNRHPNTVRLILSGYSEQEMTLRSVGAAHQFLSKPCNPEELKTTVERACALTDLLKNPVLRSFVTKLQNLPSLPSLYLELVEELRATEISLCKVGAIVARDPAMTAKMLQIVNSSFFGLRRHISNAEEAVRLLGVEMVASLALSIGVFTQFDNKRANSFSLESFWTHSLTVGKFAQWLAKSQNSRNHEEALTAGLLHDIGKLILIQNLPDEYDRVLERAKTENIALEIIEVETIGATHGEIGGYLLGLWGLPQSIVEAVAFHHRPAACPLNECGALAMVHIANALDNEAHAATATLDNEYLERINISNKISYWREAYRKQFFQQS